MNDGTPRQSREAGCADRCARADSWHFVTDLEARIHWSAGFAAGMLAGAVAAMSPAEKDALGYREDRVAARIRQMEEAGARARNGPPRKFWPAAMLGGWPLPPEDPSDESTWWPEHGGWPVPPPELRS